MRTLFFAFLISIAACAPAFALHQVTITSPDPDASKEKGAYITWRMGGDMYRVYESGNVYSHYEKKDAFEFLYKQGKKKVKEIFKLAAEIDFASIKTEITADDKPRPFVEYTKGEKSYRAIWNDDKAPGNDEKLEKLLDMLRGIV
jgi:hypothetical protein